MLNIFSKVPLYDGNKGFVYKRTKCIQQSSKPIQICQLRIRLEIFHRLSVKRNDLEFCGILYASVPFLCSLNSNKAELFEGSFF